MRKQKKKIETALKYDEGKPDLSQISLELMEGLARVRMFGEKKYARYNWKKGFKVTRSLSAALRHTFKFLSGQTVDEESGLSHLHHAVACLEHAIWDMKHNPSNDDRYIQNVPTKYTKQWFKAWFPTSEQTAEFCKCTCEHRNEKQKS